MKSIMEITKKQAALVGGATGAVAGGIYGGKKYLDSKKVKETDTASSTPAPTKELRTSPRADETGNQGMKNLAQKMSDDKTPVVNKALGKLKSDTGEGIKTMAKGFKKAGKEVADSPAGKGLKRAYDYYTKPGEGGQKFIQGQMKTVGDYWGKGGEGRDAVSGALKTAGKYWGPGGEGRQAIGAGVKTVADKMRKLASST